MKISELIHRAIEWAMRGFFLVGVMLGTMAEAEAQPHVQWLSHSYNFGAFDEGDGIVECEIKFVNTGDQPLAITSARASCGCTTSKYTKHAVEPGDTGVVAIAFNPVGRPGRFDKKVYVYTNTTPSKSTLTITGTVIGSGNTVRSKYPVEAGPLKLKRSMVAFGEVSKGRSKTEFVDAYNTSADSIRPLWADLPPYIRVAPGADGIMPGDYGSFALSFNSDACPLYGVVADTISFVPDSRNPENRFPISIVAVVNEDFSRLTEGQLEKAPVAELVPAMIDLDIVDRSAGLIERTFRIVNVGKDPLVIRRVYTSDAGIRVVGIDTMKIKKQRGATVTLSIDAEKIVGDVINARISVITNDPKHPVIPLRIVGQIK